MFPYIDSVARRYPPVIVWAVIGMNVLAFLYQCLIRNYRARFHDLAMRPAKSWMEAMKSHAVADAMICSKSLARRRFRLSQARVRSTTQRRGRTMKPFAASDRLTISIVHLPIWRNASLSLAPA